MKCVDRVLSAALFAVMTMMNLSAGEVRYFANDGDDSADGRTPATAWRTMEKLNADLPSGGTALLKRGDVFYGALRLPAGADKEHPTVLADYGKGPKPVLSEIKILKMDPTLWEKRGFDIWRMNIVNPSNYTGAVSDDFNPGFLFVDGEMKTWKRYCHSDLVDYWEFCGEDGYLYIHAPDNPALAAKSISVALNIHAVNFRSNTVISNIAVHATGAHGMYCGWSDGICENVHISDCEFENIGGSELPGYSEKIRVRYGNGIELGHNSRRALIERCSFKGTYDVAFTMQGYPSLTGWEDVTVRDCTMTDCTQAFEIWCKNAPKGMGFTRCAFISNRIERVGGGWGPVVRPARRVSTPLLIYSMQTDTVDIDVSGNTVIDAPYGLIYAAGGPASIPAGYRIHDNVLRNVKQDPELEVYQYARSEFARCVKAMTGKAAPELKFAKADADEKLGLDGFRVVAKGGVIEIRSEKGRGALYGVYDLLERFGGAGFYAPDCEVLPKRDRFTVPDGTDYAEKPAFASRTSLWYDVMRDPDFAAKLRVNGRGNVPGAKHGGSDYQFSSRYGICHTFVALLPPAEFAKDHPEYYGIHKGERFFSGREWQPCLTNPDVLKIVIERVRQAMREEPHARFFGVSQNDSGGDSMVCECENCRKVNEEEGSEAGTNVRFVNAVADAVAKEFPDKFVETLAYRFTRKPTKTAYRDNVLPCLCSIECDFSHPIDGGRFKDNVSFCQDLKGWAEKSKQLYIWDYTVDFACYPMAMPNVYVLGPNLKLFRDSGVSGVMAQGGYEGRCAGFSELKQWLIAKLEWNPDQDAAKLVKEFLAARYGAAAGEVQAVLDELHSLDFERCVAADSERKEEAPFHIYVMADDTVRIPDEFLANCEKRWQRAERLLANEPVRLKALRELALSTRYVQFSRLMDRKPVRELFLTDRTDGINEYTDEERQLAENIRQTLKTAGKVMFNEWGDATPIYRQLDAVCERPKSVAGNRVEIIDRIPVACHASPIKRVGNDIEIRPSAAWWVFRYRIGAIAYDKDAEYVLRVRVKAVRKPGVPNDTAFTFGYYDLAKRLCEDYAGAKVSETVSFGAWYELPARKFNDTLDFWFAPGDRAGDLLDSLTLTNIEIVRKEPPNEAARGFARSEFERCVAAMTGKAAPELKFTAAAKSEKLGLDGFRVLAKNGVIEIRSETGRAAIYGVYDILERFGGCGFYARNCEVLPKRETFVIPEGTDYVEKPAFGVRTALWTDARMDKDFGAKLRLDGWGNEPDWLHGGCDYLFTSEYGMCHTFTTQLPPAKYAAEHPEYYGLVDGKRYFEGFDWQPCLTNPDVLRIVTERMLEKLRAEPQAKFVGVSQNDTWFDRPNLCECENCRKVNEEEGSRAGTTVRFVNAVADAVAKEFPDKFVETLAYQFTRKPTKTAFRDNVIPCLCSIECDFAEPIDGGAYRENVSFCKDLKGWAKKSKQLYIWDYTTDYACFPLPMPNVKVLAPNLRLFRDAGVFGMMAQGAQQGRCAGFGELKQWLLSKLEWDPDQDTDVLTEEFLEARYGAAAGEIKAVLDEVHSFKFAEGDDGKPPFGIYVAGDDEDRIPDDFLKRSEEHWMAAERLVADDPVRLQAVREVALSTRYLRFLRLDKRRPVKEVELGEDTKIVTERYGESERALGAKLYDTIRNAGLIYYSENGDYVSVERRIAILAGEWRFEQPKVSQGTGGSIPLAFIDTTDYGRVKLVDDAEAKGGKAIEVEPAKSGWAIRYPLGRVAFAEGTEYVVRVRAKAKAKRGAAPDAGAFTFGSFDRGNEKCGPVKAVKVSELSSDGAWYELPAQKFNDLLDFWLAPGDEAAKLVESLRVTGVEIVSRK